MCYTLDFNIWPLVDLHFDLKWQLRPSVTSQHFSNARFRFPDTKTLLKDTNKCYTVYLNVWPPVDLHFDLQMSVTTSSDILAFFYCQIWIPRYKNPTKWHPQVLYSILLSLTSNWPPIMTFKWQLQPPVITDH